MTNHPLTGAITVRAGRSVVLSGWALEFAAWALERAAADHAARGLALSEPAWLLTNVLATVAAVGQPARPANLPRPDLDAYDTRDTAVALGVSERTVRRHASRLGGNLIGRAWRFNPATIENIAAQRNWRERCGRERQPR
jgi:hypothetical protein